jgi:preprotein translocase subunit SecD
VASWLAIVLLGWGMNYRLSMAGVAGLIVSIGMAADSFIVYFERIRDEIPRSDPE